MKLTFLQASVPLTKTFAMEDGKVKKIGHPHVTDVTSHTEEVGTLEDFHRAIREHGAKHRCLLKGNVGRALKSESRRGSTSPTAETEWACLDIDGQKDIRTVEQFMATMGLADVDYVVQYSASSGVVPDRGLSAHVFVLLATPATPDALKQWLVHKNFQVPELEGGIGLARSGNALRWTLDVSTCQNDKLIYIAPPVLGEGVVDHFEGERIQLVRKGKERARLDLDGVSAERNRKLQQAKIDVLRKAAGLESKRWDREKTAEGTPYMPDPDKATVTGVRDDGDFVHLNLNGGDSWAYWHWAKKPKFLYNFKGEPTYLLSEIVPDYWRSLRREEREERKDDGKEYLAFRDFRTARYWNGVYDRGAKQLTLAQATSVKQLEDFMTQHGQHLGEYVEDWAVEYDPDAGYVVDAPGKRVNVYRPPAFERLYDALTPEERERGSRAVPGPVEDVLSHVLGGDREAYDHQLNWLAVAVQRRCSTETSWVWHGIQGTGKGLMCDEVLRPIFGEDNVTMKRMQELDSQFNGFLERCLLLFVDEAEMSAFKTAAVLDANIKNYVVSRKLSIRNMFQAPYEVKNRINLIFASNKDDPVIIDPHDRRFNVGKYQDRPLVIDDAGVEALRKAAWPFYVYLREYKADPGKARKPLNNEAKRELAHVSQTSIDVVCAALAKGNWKFFDEQRPTVPIEQLHRFEQDRAKMYCKLVEEMKGRAVLTREEVHVLLDYVCGGMPASPAKFSALVKHHVRGGFVPVRDGDKVVRGLHVKWRD